jgi:hypothetical protein
VGDRKGDESVEGSEFDFFDSGSGGGGGGETGSDSNNAGFAGKDDDLAAAFGISLSISAPPTLPQRQDAVPPSVTPQSTPRPVQQPPAQKTAAVASESLDDFFAAAGPVENLWGAPVGSGGNKPATEGSELEDLFKF